MASEAEEVDTEELMYEDKFNPFGVDYEGSEQSEVSPTGRYSGQTTDEEEVAEAEETTPDRV